MSETLFSPALSCCHHDREHAPCISSEIKGAVAGLVASANRVSVRCFSWSLPALALPSTSPLQSSGSCCEGDRALQTLHSGPIPAEQRSANCLNAKRASEAAPLTVHWRVQVNFICRSNRDSGHGR